jgi:prepilin-type N-terminal cleavage/methylation domain-containing protein
LDGLNRSAGKNPKKRLNLIPDCGSLTEMSLKRAFTLIELLAVTAIITILTAILMPVVSKGKIAAQRTACLSNLQQLNLGCKMYTDDNGGQLVSSWSAGSGANAVNPYCWCPGWASALAPATTNAPEPLFTCTNLNALQQGKIWPYVESAAVYRCPADWRDVGGQPVVRSFSMNSWMNGCTDGDPTGYSTFDTPPNDLTLTYTLFRREGQILHPDQVWRLIEEDASTIGDSMFLVDMGGMNQAPSLPSTRHANTFALTFVDGHGANVAFQAPPAQWNTGGTCGPDPDWVNLKAITTFTNKNASIEGLTHPGN